MPKAKPEAKPEAKPKAHKWTFKARFRRHAFGWRSQPAVQRVRQAVAEIARVARKDPMLGAEGAVMFIERVSPALEHVDSSSGSLGSAVDAALAVLAPLIGNAPVDGPIRAAWLDRLWKAHEEDRIPYIEPLGDHWGTLCGSKEVASEWADRLLGITRMALSPEPNPHHGYFHGTSACLSALYRAERHREIVELVSARDRILWHYKRWAAKALAAMGKKAEAVRYAESCRNPWASDADIDRICEEILLSSGLADEAYQRYGLRTYGSTYLAIFRAIAKKYPHKQPAEILADLVKRSAGHEGKWFAAAKEAGLYDEAIALATRSPCDPMTLVRAARDHTGDRPAFATEAGILAIRWIARGHGYEITPHEVLAAFSTTMRAAEKNGTAAEARERIAEAIGRPDAQAIVAAILARELARPSS